MQNLLSLSILINPDSGQGKGKKIYKQIQKFVDNEPEFKKRIRYLEYSSSEDPEHLKTIIESSDGILICGGDGTIHHFINYLGKSNYNKMLSIFPLGTGNDFYKNLGGNEKNIVLLLRRLFDHPQIIEVDLFSVNDKIFFINYVTFGFDAFILRLYEALCKKIKKTPLFKYSIFHLGYLKKLLFFLIGLCSFVFYKKKIHIQPTIQKASPALLTPDKQKSFTSIIIHNINSYAGGSPFKVDSSINDGKLEFSYNSTKKDFAKLILNRFIWANFKLKSYTYSPPLELKFDTTIPIQVDGEDYTTSFEKCQIFCIKFKKKLYLSV